MDGLRVGYLGKLRGNQYKASARWLAGGRAPITAAN